MSDIAPHKSVPAVDRLERSTKRSFREAIAHRLRYVLLALCVVVVFSYAGRLNWIFDNLTAFVLQYAAIAVLFAVLFTVLKAPRRGVALAGAGRRAWSAIVAAAA